MCVCGRSNKTLKRKNKKRISIKVFTITTVPVVLYRMSTVERDQNQIRVAEINFLRAVKGCCLLDKVKSHNLQYINI